MPPANLREIVAARIADKVRRDMEAIEAFQKTPACAAAMRGIVAAGRRASIETGQE